MAAAGGGPGDGDARAPDMADVAALCEFARLAVRLGCRVRLLDVPARLDELLRFAGVGDALLGYSAGAPTVGAGAPPGGDRAVVRPGESEEGRGLQ